MMRSDIVKSDVVASLCGRDKGALMMVVELDSEGYALICDGRLRKVERPKRKKLKHIRLVCHTDCRAAQKIRAGERLSNSEIRRALSDLQKPQPIE